MFFDIYLNHKPFTSQDDFIERGMWNLGRYIAALQLKDVPTSIRITKVLVCED
jgi:hypothetical protein